MKSAQTVSSTPRIGNNRGFTLIEMAIVLVIIGIIMGAIMKGQDLIKGAQVKEFANSFVGKWQTISSNYYDKTGRYLGDGSTNGGTGTASGFMGGGSGLILNTSNEPTMVTALNNAGIDPCTVIKSKASGSSVCNGMSIGTTTVEGQFTTSSPQVTFTHLAIGTAANVKNVLVITSVPADVAAAIDKMYDGVADGTTGSVLNLGACAATSPTVTAGATVTPAAYNTSTTSSNAAQGFVCTIGIVQ